ncbi:MAG: amino acid racemase [Muribaculaceae bacterium]|nr:amino acid racemase [Muribaculaceae bacterium]
MKKLGLIGGTGPESTLIYYAGITRGVQRKLNRPIFPSLSIESVDVYQVLEYCEKEQYDEMVKYFMNAIQNLYNAGAEFAALTANTSHIVFDRLQESSPIRLISIIDSTLAETKKHGYRRVGLIGTKFTMEKDFYKKPFLNNDIEIIIPNEEERQYVNEKISSELELNIIKKETLLNFQRIIRRMKDEEGIEAIILGCTELPLLLNDENCPVPCLDTVQIHLETLIVEILR